MEEYELFIKIGQNLDNAEQSQMFGKPCFKVKGKAIVCFFQNEMVFKLTGERHKEAIHLEGAQLFDPSGKKRAMKEWVQVPYQHRDMWERYAVEALKYLQESY